MKRLIVLLLMAGFSASAQTTVAYLNEKKEFIKNPQKAKSYVVIQKMADSGYVINEYDKYDSLLVSGHYKDSLMQVPHGKFRFFKNPYNELMRYGVDPGTSSHNSYLFSTGYYIDGLKHGIWTEYSDTKKTYEQFTFDKGNLDGPYSAWKSYGRREGYFVNNARQGSWCDVDSAGTVLREQIYVDNKVKATNLLFKVPGLNQKFRNYLVKEMRKYREELKGRMVKVYVTVDEKGYVTDPISKDEIREELKWAINQILLKAPQVDPGTYNNIPKKVTVLMEFGYNLDAMSVKL